MGLENFVKWYRFFNTKPKPMSAEEFKEEFKEKYSNDSSADSATHGANNNTKDNTNNSTETSEYKPLYTLDEIILADSAGDVSKKETKESPYDAYMKSATDIYNQQVETNNKNAANRAAASGAGYRELTRNANELNKSNGRANTGYAGDTSIDAYNAYRNDVNTIYSDADSTNNSLYSYYLQNMAALQEAKDSKEISDREFASNERYYNDGKETMVLTEVTDLLYEDNAYDVNGNITSEYAEKVWDYITTIYGNTIPNSIMGKLQTISGFYEWISAYNNTSLKGKNNV